MGRVLVLAGTTEATELAGLLTGAGHDVVSSLAGVTSSPRHRPGRLRSGGFGGTPGLAAYLREEAVDLVVDATHPFAAVMPFHAQDAAAMVGRPHCRLLRPPWAARDGDHWVPVARLDQVPGVLGTLDAARVFLAIGRQQLGVFVGAPQWFLVRSIEPATAPLGRYEAVLDQGPFTVEGEKALLDHHRIDTVVAKNAGGDATRAKLDAARALGIRVVVVERPPQPPGATVVTTAAEAAAWVQVAQDP